MGVYRHVEVGYTHTGGVEHRYALDAIDVV